MDKKNKKEQFPVIDISSRQNIKIIYPDYSLNRDNIKDDNKGDTKIKNDNGSK